MSEQDATELIGDYQDEQIDLDTVSKLEHREDHSVLEAELVKGEPLYPHELTRDAVLSMYVMALFFYLSAFVPPPLHGAADPTAGTAFPPPLPDWYLLWAFGCLKVAWDIEFTIFGYHFFLMTAKVWGTLVQGMIVGLVVAVPFIDRAIGGLIDPQYGDVVNRGHERRPIEDPVRAAIGVYGIAMVIMLSIYSINATVSYTHLTLPTNREV